MAGTAHFTTLAEAWSTCLALLAAQTHCFAQPARGLCFFLSPCFHRGRRSGHEQLTPRVSVVTLCVDGRLSGRSSSCSAARLCVCLCLGGYVAGSVLRNLPLDGRVLSVLVTDDIVRIVITTRVPADFLAVSIVESVEEAHLILYLVSV
jgi:hypothetical protein